jgi:multiple antibiotic resistance protein
MNAFIQAVVGLFAITNPLSKGPIFAGIVKDLTPAKKRAAAVTASLAVMAILVGSALAGKLVLDLFGVSIPAFQVAGGLLIVMMALQMMNSGEQSDVQSERSESEIQDSLIVPFAMPLTAGPGAIATIITMAVSEGKQIPSVTIAAAIAVSVLLWLILTVTVSAKKQLNPRAQRIQTRFMGLILLAIGFQLGMNGLKDFFAM